MKKWLIILITLFTNLSCFADDTYRHVEYFGDTTFGCYEKLCNSYNCYNKSISCYNSKYMSQQAREGIALTLMLNLGRYPTEQEINEAMKSYYNYNRGTTPKTPQKVTAQKQAVAKAKEQEAKRKVEEQEKGPVKKFGDIINMGAKVILYGANGGL